MQAVRGREDRQTPSNNFDGYDRSDVRFTATQLLFDGYQTLDRVKAADFEARRDFQGHIRASENAALELTEATCRWRSSEVEGFADQNYFVHRQVASRIVYASKVVSVRGSTLIR